MELSQFKCLFWSANGSVVKLMVSITSGVSFRYISGKNIHIIYNNETNFDHIKISVNIGN